MASLLSSGHGLTSFKGSSLALDIEMLECVGILSLHILFHVWLGNMGYQC